MLETQRKHKPTLFLNNTQNQNMFQRLNDIFHRNHDKQFCYFCSWNIDLLLGTHLYISKTDSGFLRVAWPNVHHGWTDCSPGLFLTLWFSSEHDLLSIWAVTALPALGRAPPGWGWHSLNSASQLPGYFFPPFVQLPMLLWASCHPALSALCNCYLLTLDHSLNSLVSIFACLPEAGECQYVWGDIMGGCTATSKELTFTCIFSLHFIHQSYGHTLDLSSFQILNSKVPRNSEVLNNHL